MSTSRIDYRNADGLAKSPEDVDRKWWGLSDDDAAQSIISIVENLKNAQTARREWLARAANFYGAMSRSMQWPYSMSSTGPVSMAQRTPWGVILQYNVVQPVIDTIVANLSKNTPRPYFLTNGGSFDMQRIAKRRNEFLEGVFYATKAQGAMRCAIRDGCVWGDGIIHVYAKNGQVALERVLPPELYVDEREGQYGEPRQMFRVKQVDRMVAADMWGKDDEKIRRMILNCPRVPDMSSVNQRPSIADTITVAQGWHLPSGENADDGCSMVVCQSGVISERKTWKHDFFPFERYRWTPALFGYWSSGIPDQISDLQIELNMVTATKQRAFYMAGGLRILYDKSSKINVNDWTNTPEGTFIPYVGQAPTVIMPPVIPDQLFRYAQEVEQHAFERVGTSQLSVVARKPAGLDSAPSLREYNDIQSDRFRDKGLEHERLAVGLGDQCLTCISDITKGSRKKYSVKSRAVRASRSFVTDVEWSQTKMNSEEYTLQCFPVSSLPQQPAARLQAIKEMSATFQIDERDLRMLIDFPDIQAFSNRTNAPLENLIRILDGILDDDVYAPPEPYHDLLLAQKLALEYYNEAEMGDVDESRLDKIRQFYDEAKRMADDAAKSMMPPPPDPNAPTGGNGGAPPAQMMPPMPGGMTPPPMGGR